MLEIVMPEFKNKAWVRSKDPLCGIPENSVELITPIHPADPAIHKTGPTAVCAGESVNYQITVTNETNHAMML